MVEGVQQGPVLVGTFFTGTIVDSSVLLQQLRGEAPEYAERPCSTSSPFITTGTTRDTIRGTPCPAPLFTPAPGRAASYHLALCPRLTVLLLPPLSVHALCVQCAMQTRPIAPPSPSPRPLFGHLCCCCPQLLLPSGCPASAPSGDSRALHEALCLTSCEAHRTTRTLATCQTP